MSLDYDSVELLQSNLHAVEIISRDDKSVEDESHEFIVLQQ